MSLETILRKYFSNTSYVFDKDGNLTKSGKAAYNDLISLLYDLEELGILDSDVVADAIDELDSIVAEQ